MEPLEIQRRRRTARTGSVLFDAPLCEKFPTLSLDAFPVAVAGYYPSPARAAFSAKRANYSKLCAPRARGEVLKYHFRALRHAGTDPNSVVF